MTQQELLRRVTEVLESAGVLYVVVGSIASSIQGDPRSTHDIDLVVTMTPAGEAALLAAFPPPDFYLDESAVREARRRGGMFNLLDATGGDKVDFWLLADQPYDRVSFERRQQVNALGMRLFILRPEDTILSKLRWSKIAGGSERQLLDATRVYEVQRALLDFDYLRHWAAQLDLEPELAEVERAAETPF